MVVAVAEMPAVTVVEMAVDRFLPALCARLPHCDVLVKALLIGVAVILARRYLGAP